jgi:beta-galactosidase
MSLKHLVQIVVVLVTLMLVSAAQDGQAHPVWPGPGQLSVGACYQPVDRTGEQIVSDITVMKRAGFNVVRMGDLSWDSFEPAQGKFTFEWFDRIMDQTGLPSLSNCSAQQ